MLIDIQTQLIDHLNEAVIQVEDKDYPAFIGPYAGQLRNPAALVKGMPAVYVDVPDGEIEGLSTRGTVKNHIHHPEIIAITQNYASEERKHSDGAALMVWIYNALHGTTVTIDGQVLVVSKKMRYRLVTDLEQFAGIWTINLGNPQ